VRRVGDYFSQAGVVCIKDGDIATISSIDEKGMLELKEYPVLHVSHPYWVNYFTLVD